MRFTSQAALFLLMVFREAHSLPNWFSWVQPRIILPTERHEDDSRPSRRFRTVFGRLLYRGGSSNNGDGLTNNAQAEDSISSNEEVIEVAEMDSEVTIPPPAVPPVPKSTTKKSRHSSDMILDLHRRSSVSGSDESFELRELITRRAHEYMVDTRAAVDANEIKLPHPRKLLHYLAPKVPAIKQSPDVNLRIHSARSDMDSGVASCIIGVMAHVCEIYDKETIQRPSEKPGSAAPEITMDRRFEQLVECVLSGVNVKKRKRESLLRRLDREDTADIEEILDEEQAQEDEGLNTRDACRAAWGLAILGAHHLDTLGNVKVLDLLLALSLRIREILLARLQLLRQDDILSEGSPHATTEERLDELAEELAEDAVSAMWTFACVRACTGMRSVPLFEACCSIICQDPVDMRRRAQEADYEAGNPTIGTSDVIDRLARSEEDAEAESRTKSSKEIVSKSKGLDKDALLDWLSPTEVNDILWALALHGSANSTSASDELTLSETASALREIAFDRMLEWLEEDLQLSPDMGGTDQLDDRVVTAPTLTVEVVDAASLLASAGEPSPNLSSAGTIPVENIRLKTSQRTVHGGDVQEVEVVDAAALLASIEEGDPVAVETEVMMAPTSVMDGSERAQVEADQSPVIESSGPHATETYHEIEQAAMFIENPQKRLFSPHDLASIAWSVTELRDPLRNRVVGMVIELVSRLGPRSGTDRMNGADLANLAWAVAKFDAEEIETDKNRDIPLPVPVVSWIAQRALEKVQSGQPGEADVVNFQTLHIFQPPELGRLLWAIAFTKCNYSHTSSRMRSDDNIQELARLALQAAASNLSLFATEDLLRVSWAFLEIYDIEAAFSDLSIVNALGRVLATVEQSLHRWERGECNSPSPNNDSTNTGKDTSTFSSFFGKPRTPLLEQMMSDHDVEDDSELASLIEKSRRPLLRDLSVDPSTLCKAASAFERLSVKHPRVKGGWTLTRIALRLLSSKDARLMRECSIQDIVRICEAAVLSDPEGNGRELIAGLFAHRVIEVLNDALDDGLDGSIDISTASPCEMCTLVWALGELGAKHSIEDENRESAHKKLRLVAERPFLTKREIQDLDTSSSIKLFQGLVRMKYFASDKMFLLNVLKDVQSKSTKLDSTSELCCLAESLALLRDALISTETGKDVSVQSSTEEKETSDNVGMLDKATEGSSDQPPEEDTPAVEESVIPIDDSSVDDELSHSCDEILASIATQAKGIADRLTAVQMRRFLTVYSLLPFQADELIDHLDTVISKRLSFLQKSRTTSLETLLKKAHSSSSSVNRVLFEDSSESRFGAIKNGFLSLFRSANDSEAGEDKSEENSLTEELAAMIENSITATSAAATRAKEIRRGLSISLDSMVHDANEGSAFELGRCQELIENYRRMEFSTGKLRSRYDKERRKDIAKRVLSRLLP